MKVRFEILLEENPDLTLTFEFSNLYDFKNFLGEWLNYTVMKSLKAKITLESKQK